MENEDFGYFFGRVGASEEVNDKEWLRNPLAGVQIHYPLSEKTRGG